MAIFIHFGCLILPEWVKRFARIGRASAPCPPPRTPMVSYISLSKFIGIVFFFSKKIIQNSLIEIAGTEVALQFATQVARIPRYGVRNNVTIHCFDQ